MDLVLFLPFSPGPGVYLMPRPCWDLCHQGRALGGQADPSAWPVRETGSPAQAHLLIWGGPSGLYGRGPARNHLVAHIASSPPGSVSGAPGLDCLGSQGGFPGAQSQDCIAAALACSKMLKELSKEEEDTDSLEEMLALASEFEHRAVGELMGPAGDRGPALHTLPWGPRSRSCPDRGIWRSQSPTPSPAQTRIFLLPGVFTECHRKDEERAQKLLTRVSEAWGRTTCLQLALEAKDMKFVSHGGIQVTL